MATQMRGNNLSGTHWQCTIIEPSPVFCCHLSTCSMRLMRPTFDEGVESSLFHLWNWNWLTTRGFSSRLFGIGDGDWKNAHKVLPFAINLSNLISWVFSDCSIFPNYSWCTTHRQNKHPTLVVRKMCSFTCGSYVSLSCLTVMSALLVSTETGSMMNGPTSQPSSSNQYWPYVCKQRGKMTLLL